MCRLLLRFKKLINLNQFVFTLFYLKVFDAEVRRNKLDFMLSKQRILSFLSIVIILSVKKRILKSNRKPNNIMYKTKSKYYFYKYILNR